MIRLPNVVLDAQTAQSLANYQAEIDALANYADKVEAAGREWKRRNVAANPVFQAVRQTLISQCCGARRCGYCEDSRADEIDHVRPKSFYPEATFDWDNYVYACGPCNGPKNNRFAVFCGPNRDFTQLQRARDETPTEPPPGEMAIIHPRFENPLDFLFLDLRDTFNFYPSPTADSFMRRRAEYTIDVLRLNLRDDLKQARGEAYGSFMGRLHRYVRRRSEGAATNELTQLREALQSCQHQSVWQEMKRQGARIPELKALFEEVPEALTW